jgi:cystathionine gamma-synthase
VYFCAPDDPSHSFLTAQGVSVHLPKWADTVGWASREPRVLNAMKTGYPRFFIPRVVDRLAMQLLDAQQRRAGETGDGEKGAGTKLAIVLDSVGHAQTCRKTLPAWNDPASERFCPADIGVYIVSWEGRITPVEAVDGVPGDGDIESAVADGNEDVVLVTYPAELAAEAKVFWQHTGYGISSRRATHWLEHAPFLSTASPDPGSMPSPAEIARQAEQARSTLKSRIAAGQSSAADNLEVSPSDVFLFPTGMTAIAEIAAAIKSLRRATPDNPYRVAVFG